ncbi:MAG: ATP-binding protein, partial [Bacteroidales bacterium]|nr:ATP-binding protein [Bacteroidales bacterium]
MLKNRKIKELSDREWLLLRPHNIIGSIQKKKQTGFVLHDDGKFHYEDFFVVPAFLKIVNEIIDNSVDVFIKSGGKSATKIEVDMSNTVIKVKDNGYGIPVIKEGDKYMPEIAWGRPRAGSNFEDDENRDSMGMNGIGSYATAVFSTKFTGTTCDGKKKMVVKFTDNLAKKDISAPVGCKVRGTMVEFTPDLKRFGMNAITNEYKNNIKQRLINLSFSYPGITFKFNKEIIKVDPKSYFSRFGDDVSLFQGDNYSVAIMPNDSDDFRFLAYTNGLHNTKGGSQITYFLDRIIPPLKEKLNRKYKGIKTGDIKNKLT